MARYYLFVSSECDTEGRPREWFVYDTPYLDHHDSSVCDHYYLFTVLSAKDEREAGEIASLMLGHKQEEEV